MRATLRPLALYATLLLGASAPGAAAVSPLVLARVPVEGSLAGVSLPVHALLVGADGAEYALVLSSAERLALTPRALALGPAASAREFVVALERRPGARRQAPALAEVLFDDGRQVVARADEAQAEALALAGFDLARLSDAPMVPSPSAPAVRLSPAAYDWRVAEMAAQVTEDAVYGIARGLSGAEPVTVGGSPYTISTRHTRSGTPIQMATQLAYERFGALGLTTTYQSWSVSTTSGRNVVGERTGTSRPSEIVLICAHLDDMPTGATAPGADDNGSGSTAVLLAAQILSSHAFERTVRFVLFTGEEQGLYGSAAYATLLSGQGANVVAVLNLDMISYNGGGLPTLRLHTRTTGNAGYAADQAIATTFKSAVTSYVGNGLIPIDDPDGITASDHSPFWNKGWPAILGIEDDVDDFTPYYHTTGDTLATQNRAYYTSFAKAAVATAAHLALPATLPTRFEPVTPCRLLDTRDDQLPPGLGVPELAAQESRAFVVASVCGIPAGAVALAVNVTAVDPAAVGSLTLWPGNGPAPTAGNVSFPVGKTRAAFSILPLDGAGSFTVKNGSNGTVHLVVDVSGVFR
ncbi:MAG: Zn-dependent exopeptidase M28 [Holophagales bacterium]|nr:Zn-dependent exopeptidase M28 [Holophagales bacterium]